MTTIKSLPSIPTDIDAATRAFLNGVKDWFNIREGFSGDPMDRFVSGNDLIALTGIEIDSLSQQGALSYDSFKDAMPSEVLDVPTGLIITKAQWSIRLSWIDPAGTNLNGIRIIVSETNDLNAYIFTMLVAPGTQGYTYYPTDLSKDYYFWIRAEGFTSGAYSPWVPDNILGGQLVLGYETIDETIQSILGALQGMDPPLYDAGTTYKAGQHVLYNTKVWRCYNDNAGTGITGIAPDSASGPSYWVRDGILVQGEVDGVDMVGIDGSLVVDGTIMSNAIQTGAITVEHIGDSTQILNRYIGYNLIENGDFEADYSGQTQPTGWTVTYGGTPATNCLVWEATGPHVTPWDPTGNVFDVENLEGGYQCLNGNMMIPVVASGTYCLSAWVKGSNSCCYLGLQCYDSAQAYLGYSWVAMNGYAAGSTWEQKYGAFVPNQLFAGTRYVRVISYPQYLAAGYTLISRIQLTEGSVPIRWDNKSPYSDNTKLMLEADSAIVNGKTMIVGGYLSTDFIAANTIAASKLVVTDINALSLANAPAAAGADVTATQVNAGVTITATDGIVVNGGNLKFMGSNSDPGDIHFASSNTTIKLAVDAANQLSIYPMNNGVGRLLIGSDGNIWTSAPQRFIGVHIYTTENVGLYVEDGSIIEVETTGITMYSESGGYYHYIKDSEAYNAFYSTESTVALGRDVDLWKEVWAVDGTINTSDESAKTEVRDGVLGLQFIRELRPISFKWANGGIRRHYGLSAQDVESVIAAQGLSDTDFAGFCRTRVVDVEYVDRKGKTRQKMMLPDEAALEPDKYEILRERNTYGLRNHEFTGPIIKAIQEFYQEFQDFRDRVELIMPPE